LTTTGTVPDLTTSTVVKLRPERVGMASMSKEALDTLSRVVFRNSQDGIFSPGNATEVFMMVRCVRGALAMLALRTLVDD
jgi:hypothetical protein